MPSLFDQQTSLNMLHRIRHLEAGSERKWGTMTAAQMMAHCSQVFEMSLGDKGQGKRSLPRKIMGMLIKKIVLSPKPYKQGLPTGKEFIVSGEKEFFAEQEKLINYLNRFLQTGEANIIKNEHALLGRLTVDEWGFVMWKHLNHHLTQFSA